MEKDNTEKLLKYHQYCVKSIGYDLSYGGCKFGVFSVGNPAEWLHTLDNELIKYCLHVLYEELLSVDQCIELDNVAKGLTHLP